MKKKELVALLLLSIGCLLTVNVLCLFPMVPWVGLQGVIAVFPDNTHYLNQQPLDAQSKALLNEPLLSAFY